MDQAQQIKKRLAELQNRGTFGGYTVYTDFLGLEEQSLLAEVTGPREGARYRTKQNPVIDGEVRSKQKMHRAGVYLKRALPSLGVRQPHRRGYLHFPAAAPPWLSFCGG